MIKFSRNIFDIKYAIRDFVPIARELERKGVKVIYLNIGDPLRYDFNTPRHIIEAMYKASKQGHNYYSESQGIYELREAISEYIKYYHNLDVDPDRIVVTNGVAEAINFVIRAFSDPGDEVLIPSPSYPAYISVPKLFHARPVEYICRYEDGFQPDPDDIRRKISDKTKLIILNSPNNPTGSIYGDKVIREIMDLAGEYNIPVVSDEIYDRIILMGSYIHPAKYAKDILYIGLNGFSKQFLMTGWRLGYIYVLENANSDKFIEAVLKQARARLSPNTPAQYGAIAALKGGDDHLRDMLNKVRRRAELFTKLVNELDGFQVDMPRATFYIFPKIDVHRYGDDFEFTRELLRREGVYLVPGSGFGEMGYGHFRGVTLAPESMIEEAFHRIDRFIRKYVESRLS